MVKYSEEEYVNMKFRVDKIDVNATDPIQYFPELKFYPEFSDEKLIRELLEKNIFNKIFIYIVYSTDINSPYVRY